MNLTLEQHIQDFLAYCRQKGHSKNTILAYQNALYSFQEYAKAQGIQAAEEVTRQCLRHYATAVTETLNPGGAHARLRPVKTFFLWLEADEVIAKSPMRRVSLPKLPRQILAAVGPEEIKRLLGAATSSKYPLRDKAIVATLFDTGLRVSELCGLNLEDVHAGGKLEVRTAKGGQSRIVPISRVTLRHITRYIQAERPKSRVNTLFLTNAQTQMNRNTVSQLLRRLSKEAQIPAVSPHAFRRGFAVNYLRNSGDVFTLQRILGHATLEMTNRYAVLMTEDLKEVHRRASPMSTLNEER